MYAKFTGIKLGPPWLQHHHAGQGKCPACLAQLAYRGPHNAGLHFRCPKCAAWIALTEVGTPTWETVLGEPACDKCGAGMERRFGKFGAFWGCPGWKECKGGKPGPRIRVEERAATLELRAWKAYVPDGVDDMFTSFEAERKVWQGREDRMKALQKGRWQKR